MADEIHFGGEIKDVDRAVEMIRSSLAAHARARRESAEFAAWLRETKERWLDALERLAGDDPRGGEHD